MSNQIVTYDAQELMTAWKLAEVVVRSGLQNKNIRTVEQAIYVILAGHELGIPPIRALRTLFVVEGKVFLSAEEILAALARAGVRHTWVRTNDQEAVLELQREGYEPYTHMFTLDDARQAGLLGKDVWKRYPAAMLRARCISAAARAYAPDATAGVYVPDEADDVRRGTAPAHAERIELNSERVEDAEKERTAALLDEVFKAPSAEALLEVWTNNRPAIEALPAAYRTQVKQGLLEAGEPFGLAAADFKAAAANAAKNARAQDAETPEVAPDSEKLENVA